jgi:hypothetical protein
MDELTKRLVESFISGGIPGTILAFILWKIAPAVARFREEITAALRRLEEALHRRTVADLMRLAVDPAVSERMKDAARELIKEIGDAEAARMKEKSRAEAANPPLPPSV